MIVNDLSKLAALIEEDSVPAWIRKELELKRPDIVIALNAGKSYSLHGPGGEIVTISSDCEAASGDDVYRGPRGPYMTGKVNNPSIPLQGHAERTYTASEMAEQKKHLRWALEHLPEPTSEDNRAYHEGYAAAQEAAK